MSINKKKSRKKKKHLKRKKDQKKNQSLEGGLSQILNNQSLKKTKFSEAHYNEKTNEEIKFYEAPKTSKNEQKKKLSVFHFFSPQLFEVTCLVLVTLILYSATIDHSFHFDDAANIWSNPYIQISSLSFDKLVTAGFKSVNAKSPVENISFALNYYLHGLEVRGYHYVNIFIHLLAGIILYYFVKATLCLPLYRDKYSKSQFIPFFTALIWLVHPLHIQSVTYIVQRMNSMAGMFFIMTMLFYVKARLTPEKTKKILLFLFSLIASIFAFGSKQNTATLPLFILLYECYFFQDLRLKFSKKQLFWIAAIGCVFVIVLFLFLGSSPLDKLFPSYSGRPFSMTERFGIYSSS